MTTRYILTMALIVIALGGFAALFITLNHGHLNIQLTAPHKEK